MRERLAPLDELRDDEEAELDLDEDDDLDREYEEQLVTVNLTANTEPYVESMRRLAGQFGVSANEATRRMRQALRE